MTPLFTESILKKKQVIVKEMTKGEITKSALIELKCRGVNAWVQNNLAVPGRKFIGRKGVSDILGFVERTNYYERLGCFVICEVKTINDTIKPDQEVFLNQAVAAGCIALIATQEGNQVVLKQWPV